MYDCKSMSPPFKTMFKHTTDKTQQIDCLSTTNSAK
jgi:hypothetical protein